MKNEKEKKKKENWKTKKTKRKEKKWKTKKKKRKKEKRKRKKEKIKKSKFKWSPARFLWLPSHWLLIDRRFSIVFFYSPYSLMAIELPSSAPPPKNKWSQSLPPPSLPGFTSESISWCGHECFWVKTQNLTRFLLSQKSTGLFSSVKVLLIDLTANVCVR